MPRFRVIHPLAILATLAAPAQADPPRSRAKPTQFVLISFDSAHELAQWHRSRALAQRSGARFTYFLSCVFLLSPETRRAYQPPGMGAGRSNIGFAQSPKEVAERLSQIRLAAKEGHEIGSHGCGHFDGGKWTATQWRAEFAQFANIVTNAYTLNGIGPTPHDWPAIAASIDGFRAPYLSTNPALYSALAAAGYRYDASDVSRDPAEPVVRDRVARFALPQIPEGPNERRVIAMDYNLYVRHSGGKERPEHGALYEERAYRAFRDVFDAEFNNRRRPLQLGFHFSLMNGAAYWRALERFVDDNCTRPGVACVTYDEYLRRVSTAGG